MTLGFAVASMAVMLLVAVAPGRPPRPLAGVVPCAAVALAERLWCPRLSPARLAGRRIPLRRPRAVFGPPGSLGARPLVHPVAARCRRHGRNPGLPPRQYPSLLSLICPRQLRCGLSVLFEDRGDFQVPLVCVAHGQTDRDRDGDVVRLIRGVTTRVVLRTPEPPVLLIGWTTLAVADGACAQTRSRRTRVQCGLVAVGAGVGCSVVPCRSVRLGARGHVSECGGELGEVVAGEVVHEVPAHAVQE